MKTLLFFSVIGLILFSSYSSQKDDTDWAELNLSGKVKSITSTSYEAEEKFGEIVISEIRTESESRTPAAEPIEKITFNKKGNIIEINRYGSDGSLASKSTYKYDDEGNRIELNRYDSDGNLSWKETYKNDNEGNRIEMNTYGSDGSLSWKRTYKYDDEGNKIEISIYEHRFGRDGNFFGKSTYKYDDEGNRIEINRYGSDGSLASKITYKYDDEGNRIEENKYIQFYDPDGSLTSKHTYKYEYDKKGNWISRIEFEDDVPEYITEREIEYFD